MPAGAKQQKFFSCGECGAQFPKWAGRCATCGAWNTLVEEKSMSVGSGSRPALRPVALGSVETLVDRRIDTRLPDLNFVLGGNPAGLVPGSLVLLGGDPGIGKSTLALQVALQLATEGRKTLYVTGEESLPQVGLRAARLPGNRDALDALAETDLEAVIATLDRQRPEIAVIDSIQTLYSQQVAGVSGGVAQVSYATSRLLELAKSRNIATLIIGHVTKEGNLAGPRLLEHMVDVVLYLEGERDGSVRILRCVKNRFGPTSEVAILDMGERGLQSVTDPSALFLAHRVQGSPGNVITAAIEGTRALLLEIQSLTVKSSLTYPRRTANGFDLNRMQLLAAVLGKRAGIHLADQDIYLSVAGGYQISGPESDLAVALAIASSALDRPVDDRTAVFGELGLSGEVRPVPRMERRSAEAVKMGFKTIILPAGAKLGNSSAKFVPVQTIRDALRAVFGPDKPGK